MIGKEEQAEQLLKSSFEFHYNASIWTQGNFDDDTVSVVTGTEGENFEDDAFRRNIC